jgi:GxxExxY protein
VHPLYEKAQSLTGEIIAAAIEVHRQLGPGLIESIYERCLCRELELRGLRFETQRVIPIEYKGVTFEETLRFDVLVEGCVLVENKCAESVLPIHRAILVSYMKLLDVPLGLIFNYHVPVLKDGIVRRILPGADQP